MKNKWIKLTVTTFVRNKGELIYLFNQLNYAERYYSEDSQDFIESLKKKARSLEDILDELCATFEVDRAILRADYLAFIYDLEADGFVITGNSTLEIQQKEPGFSYKRFTPQSNFPKAEEPQTKRELAEHSSVDNISISDELYVENLYLEITRRCNEKCLHCYIPQVQRSTGNFISLVDVKKYLDQAEELGIWQITLTGGEPFMHPQINEILLYARQKDVIISILSNLTVLRLQHIEVLKKIYPSHIQVSLYSLKPETHDAITCLPGSHKKTMRSIELCYENDIPLQINCPVIETNRNDFKDVIAWAKSKGMKANTDFNIMAQTDFSKENMKNTLTAESVKQVYVEMLQEDKEQLKEIQQVLTNGAGTKIPIDKHICGAAYNTLFISTDGKVYPCATWQSFELGDLNKDSLRNIYFNGKASKEVRSIKFKDYPEAIRSDLFPFMKICPAHNANSFDGDYRKIPEDVSINAKLKLETVKELLNK